MTHLAFLKAEDRLPLVPEAEGEWKSPAAAGDGGAAEAGTAEPQGPPTWELQPPSLSSWVCPHRRAALNTMVPGLVSSLTTVRNGESYLREALDSLLAQRDCPFEVVVVDDGSTDGTAGILRECEDPRLTALSLPGPGRVPALREAARVARGEFLAILDADDVALPRRFAVQRAYLERHPEVALVGAAAIEFGADGEIVKPVPSGRDRVRRALAMYNPFYFSSVMVRRTAYDAVGGFPEELGSVYDKAFLVEVARRCAVDILPEPLIRFRRHPQQWSRQRQWETEHRRASTAYQLRAAAALGLPAPLWVVPLLHWVYARLPLGLRPVGLREPLKRWLLRRAGVID